MHNGPDPAKRPVARVILVACIIGILLALTWALQVSRSRTRQIVLVVPVDYSGLVRVCHDGSTLRTRTIETIVIDSTGSGKYSTPGLFNDWHILHARRTDGSPIPVMDRPLTPTTVLAGLHLFLCNVDVGGCDLFFVGTLAERLAAQPDLEQRLGLPFRGDSRTLPFPGGN